MSHENPDMQRISDSSFYFESLASPERHVDRLYTVAKLYGVSATSPDQARVLEIACGRGVNLIPQAIRYPKATFVGMDLDAAAIEEGNGFITSLGLENIRLVVGDIKNGAPAEISEFDYSICHGLFSWCPPSVRHAILQTLKTGLSANGVAFVSYNALPGWYSRGMIAQLLQENDDLQASEVERVAAVRRRLDSLLSDFEGDGDDSGSNPLVKELESCRRQSDSFILHELLNPHSRGFHIRRFVELSEEAGLSYVGDALPGRMRSNIYFEMNEETEVVETADSEAGLIVREQQVDHLFPIPVRAALLTRGSTTALEEPDIEVARDWYTSCSLVPLTEKADLLTEREEVFVGPHGSSVEVRSPLLKAALVRLRTAWPATVSFSELLEHSRALSDTSESLAESEERVLNFLKKLFLGNYVEFHYQPLSCTSRLPGKPSTPVFARLQSEFSAWVTTIRHEYQTLDEFERVALQQLDGSRDFDELLVAVIAELKRRGRVPMVEGKEVESEDTLKELVGEHLRDTLQLFVESGLFLE